MRVGFVLTKAAEVPAARAVMEAFRELVPRGAPLLALQNDEPSDVLTLHPGEGESLMVAAVDAVIPDGEAQSAAEFSVYSLGTGWSLPDYKAHLIVAYQDSPEREPLSALSLFTQMLAAVARAADAVGVYWGDAGATHPADFFIDVAKESPLPVMLWTGVSMARPNGMRVSLLSLGMGQLGLPDLMLDAPTREGNEALGFFFDLLTYMSERGEAIPDGDTVGRSQEEKLLVEYIDSPIDDGKTVIRVELPEPVVPTIH